MSARNQTVIQAIASTHASRTNCANSGNTEWEERWDTYLSELLELLPSGSGFDNGTTLKNVFPRAIEFATAFHHMNDGGFYDGWTEHLVVVTADFDGFTVTVTGRNKRDIKEYIADVFHAALSADAPAPSWRTPAHA